MPSEWILGAPSQVDGMSPNRDYRRITPDKYPLTCTYVAGAHSQPGRTT